MLVRLREARLACGLTQAQVAKQLGRPVSFVSKSELGERRLDPIDLQHFARIYGVPITALLPQRTEHRSRVGDEGVANGGCQARLLAVRV